jgi:phasin
VNTTPRFEVPSAVRDVAEKSIDQARQAFDSFISTARSTAEKVQSSAELARKSTQGVGSHAFQAAEQNVKATLDFAQTLIRAKSLQEAMQLQAEFTRSQFAVVQAQAKELSNLAQGALKQGAEQVHGRRRSS